MLTPEALRCVPGLVNILLVATGLKLLRVSVLAVLVQKYKY
jgi:hypothetical protein